MSSLLADQYREAGELLADEIINNPGAHIPCALAEGSRARAIYGADEISERHRHRWEVNNAYRELLEEKGLRISGVSPGGGLVEMVELPTHPWFLAGQFHPELKSRPTRPQPLFASFIQAAMRRRDGTSAPSASQPTALSSE